MTSRKYKNIKKLPYPLYSQLHGHPCVSLKQEETRSSKKTYNFKTIMSFEERKRPRLEKESITIDDN